jgi:hypothetical protein
VGQPEGGAPEVCPGRRLDLFVTFA